MPQTVTDPAAAVVFEATEVTHLRALVRFMRETGVGYLRSGDVELELDPAPAVVAPPSPPAQHEVTTNDGCACGHSIEVDHGPMGCTHGCDVGLCNSTGKESRP